MQAIIKLMVAALTLAGLGAAAAHTIPTQVIPQPSIAAEGAAIGADGSKSYADWQGAATQSFGARFLAQGAPWGASASGTTGHGLTLQMFDGLDKMQALGD